VDAAAKEIISGILQKIFELIVNSGAAINPAEFTDRLEQATATLPDQFMSLNNFERFLATTPNSASVLSDLSRDAKLFSDFLKVISFSQYLADILVTHPSYFRFLFSPTGIESPLKPESLLVELTNQVGIYRDVSRKNDFVRRVYKREILRIGGRDICGVDNLENTTLQISQLAECILQVFFVIAAAEVKAKRGPMKASISCVALGKFGGNELNYSSDIDLIFLYAKGRGQGDPEASEEANIFVSELIRHLTAESAEGHLYRIDLRLRPDGSSSAAAQSLEGMIAYYESRGELWERQMLIKARHVAGDDTLSAAFLNHLRPFIYPRTWLENPIDEIPRMKIRIETANPNEYNIKLRRGGIRDIEFVVQALQLLNGGSNPEIQTGNTLRAIKLLGKNKILSKQETNLLSNAYKFFRLVEHRLQLFSNQQTHTLPTDAVEFRNLTKRCGYKNERKFRNELFGNFDAVSELFNNVFRIEQPIERSEIEQLLEGSISDERTRRVLENYGLVRLEESYRNVQYLSRGITRAGDIEFPSGVTKAFREVAPGLFEDIKMTVDQDLTLKNLSRVITAVKSLEVFYKSLADDKFRKIILTLCSKATRFVDYLTVEPLLLDLAISPERLLDVETYFSPNLSVALIKEFNEIKLGTLYLLEDIPLSETQAKWSLVAERFFTDAVARVFPRNAPVILAGGKFGSREMAFTSDLDVLFILPDKFKQSKPAYEKKIPDIQKKLLDANGNQVFTMDLKLRPEGKSAPLLMTESEYEAYLEKRLSVWEVMAMTRFRSIAPSARVDEAISRTLRDFKLTRTAIKEISDLYGKVIQSKSYFHETDVKSGDGGMFAVEFLVQTLVVAHLDKLHMFLPDTIAGLVERLKGLKILSEDAADEIRESYAFYRMIEFSIYASLSKTNHKIPHDERELSSLSAHLDFKNADEFLDSLKSRMRRISSLFRKVITDITEELA
jgi:[glutamine synthetase] adenylyltransferase / [glutamine synthetase]-adenylyl-L-tyrosine phosphorylase